jgi:hypothetical protein
MGISKVVNIIALMTVTIFASSCARNTVTADRPPNAPPAERKEALRVNSAEIFARWGQGQKNYVKLERWKDTSDPNIPHPQTFDVVCQLENVSDSSVQHGDFIALVTMEFIVAPTYLHNGDVNKIMNGVSWSRIGTFDDLKMEVVPFMAKGEKSQIKFKDFSLEQLLNNFKGEGDTLWPWALRANIHILNRDMVQVAQGQVIMPMIPSDKRLATK